MNSDAIISRAIHLLECGPLPESHSDHGEWCPYCAIALAKSQIEDEEGTELPASEVLRQCFYGFRLTDSDEPLLEARQKLGKLYPPYSKDQTLSALRAVRSH